MSFTVGCEYNRQNTTDKLYDIKTLPIATFLLPNESHLKSAGNESLWRVRIDHTMK